MGLIDFILNLAGLLLWLNWCSVRFDPLARPPAKTLLGALKRAGPANWQRWKFIAALASLLLVRAAIYWQIGPALDWTPTLNLAAIVLPFRSEFFGRILLYSVLSFLGTLLVFYLWLLFLAIVNRGVSDEDPFQKLVRLHLGRVARWPRAAQLLLPMVMVVGLWLVGHPLLVRWEIIAGTQRNARIIFQSLLIGGGAYLAWRHLIACLLLLYLLNSYVYLGNQPVWSFVNATSRNLLAPFRRVPLHVGKVDFAPVVEIVLVFLLTETALHWLREFYPV
jgi:uncharacterized protein YggT (Ycf19 family)